jgi:hypothetical protein
MMKEKCRCFIAIVKGSLVSLVVRVCSIAVTTGQVKNAVEALELPTLQMRRSGAKWEVSGKPGEGGPRAEAELMTRASPPRILLSVCIASSLK